jgi:hypothetical protein
VVHKNARGAPASLDKALEVRHICNYQKPIEGVLMIEERSAMSFAAERPVAAPEAAARFCED